MISRPRRAPILDGRLSAAMALAGRVGSFADIGADHGRLSAVMLLEGGADYGLVADVSEKALMKARGRLEGLGLSDRVVFAVADGLDALKRFPDKVDVVFILGMGGDTISGILERGAGRLEGAALILGAQTELPVVRKTLCDIGYRLRREVIAHDGGRNYVLMRAQPALPDEPAYTEAELLLGPMLMRDRPPEWLPVLKRHRRLLGQAVEAMKKSRLEKDRRRLADSERELTYVDNALECMTSQHREEESP